MSNLEDAMNKYFGSEHGDRTTVTCSVLESSAGDLEADLVHNAEKHLHEKSLGQQVEVDLKTVSTSVKLDLENLKSHGIITSNPRDHILLEEYRNIKRPLLKNAFGQGVPLVDDGHLVLITSSLPGEGKSFTSINLAFSMARELDRTILLVDADVSRQGVSRMLGIENRRGLTDILSNKVSDITEVLVRFEEPQLTFLPAGHMHPHVPELLASENMRRLSQALVGGCKERMVLFDGPPILASSDARILAGLVGQVLMVVEAERTPLSIMKEAISFLDNSKAIGLVLNKSRQRARAIYSYGYHDPRIAAGT